MIKSPFSQAVVVIILSVTSGLMSMPPRPGWLRNADREAVSRVRAVQLDARRRGMNAPGVSLLETMAQVRRDDEITLNVAVILVDFADNEADEETHPVDHYLEMLFSLDEYETGSMRDYYLENSNGDVSIIGEVAGWYRMERTYEYYCNHEYGLGRYPRNAQRLAEDALRAADGDLDYGDFDNDGDGTVEAVFIVHAGVGAEEDPENRDLIWSHAWNVRNVGELDGVRFHKYSTEPENGNIGVYGHELGHALFGLPDLYDTDYNSAGIGFWSMMSFGAWGDEGRRPLHFDAWCKLRLGWVEIRELEHDAGFSLPPVETSQEAVILWTPGERDDEYFLVENRRRIGFDGEIPAEGLLVYHVDEDMRDNDHPWWPGHQGNRHNLLALEQADGRWDLEEYENDGDDGDPFPGSEDNRTFDADSSPGSRDYDGGETGVAILDIEPDGEAVSARWLVGVEAPDMEQAIAIPGGWNIISARVEPVDDDVTAVMEPLAVDDNLMIMKDGRGRFYIPRYGYNNIPGWNISRGYQVRLQRNAELTVTGRVIDAQRSIQLEAGWQIVPYYPDYPLPARRAFAAIVDHLLIVKDAEGRFYLPRFDYSNMEELTAGKGYFVNVRDDVELVYPEPE